METDTQDATANAEQSADNNDGNDEYENELVNCADVTSADEWVHLEAEVVQLWEKTSEKIAQVGLLADGTDSIKFVSWEKSDLPRVEEGESYRFEDVVTSEYESRYSVNLNSASSVEQLDGEDEITTADPTEPVTNSGALVSIQSGSGLIKRCPHEDCSLVLRNGRCADHGHVDGDFDLRVKAALDNGTSVESIVLNAEATADITGTSIDEAVEMAKDALDTTVVADQFRSQLVGRYFEVTGPVIDQYHFVNEIEEVVDQTASADGGSDSDNS